MPLRDSTTGHSIDSHIRYADRVFDGIRLDHTQIAGSTFYDCTFDRCSFIESVLRGCRFVHCVFRHSDLSLAQVPETGFSSTVFEDAKMIGMDWTQAHWSQASLGTPIRFLRCAISHSTFIGLRLTGIKFEDCIAADVDFREADLTRADFAGSDLSKSLFGNTNLTEADLSRARNYQIDPGACVLKRAIFAFPEAMSLLYAMDIKLVNPGQS